MKKYIPILLICSFILILVGCGTTEPTISATEPPVEVSESSEPIESVVAETAFDESPLDTVQYKDQIIYAHSTDAITLNATTQSGTNTETIVFMMYNALLKFDENFKVVGDLAESWSVSDDDLSWTFKLKQGVKFHNGKVMTAHDFKATYDYALNPDNGFTVASLSMIEEISVPDDYTLVLKTSKPYGVMERVLCDIETAVQDSEYIEKFGAELGSTVESVNGTGPYKPVEWIRDVSITLERFDDYFGEVGGTKTIVYRVIPDAAARAIALETGEIDIAVNLAAEDVARLESMEGFQNVKRTTVNQRLFRFGCNDPIMSNTKVRQAIVYAIDRQLIIDALFPGLVNPATAPVSPLTFGYKNLGVIEQDLEKAKALLADAGYPDGFDTKIVTTTRYEKGVELAEVISAQLSEIGINAEIDVWEWAAISSSWNTMPMAEFDQPMFIMGGGYGSADSDGELRLLYGAWESETARKNYGFYVNDEVTELLNKAAVETDQSVREQYYHRVVEILYLEDPGGIWLFDQLQVISTTDKVAGFRYLPNAVVNLAYVTAQK